MYQPNVEKILAQLSPNDKVLDIGGWACPFNRANWVMDMEPYDTRGFYGSVGLSGSQGGEKEHFTKDTWVVRDLCAREPYPFKDKEFDYVICSQVLEDLRDPLWVCNEMSRISKRGYLEVPSRAKETCRGWEHNRLAGLSHHRWLIDIKDGVVSFLQKYHLIHSHWRFSLPKSFFLSLRGTPEEEQWLFWEDSIKCEERALHGLDAMEAELTSFVQSVRPYPTYKIKMALIWEKVAGFYNRVLASRYARRILGFR